MTTLNISLPETLKEFIDEQVSEQGFPTANEYLQHLIKEEHRKKAQAKLEALLLEGLNSGEPIEVTEEYWREKRERLTAEYQQKTS